MPQLRIVNRSGIGFGTEAFLDGVPLRSVKDIKLHLGIEEMATADIEMVVEEGLELNVPADVHIHLHLPEGCQLIDVTRMGDKGRVRQVLRVKEL